MSVGRLGIWTIMGSIGALVLAAGCSHEEPVGEVEVITQPDTPSGAPLLIADSTATYTTGGAASSLGHPLQYSFEWGDGRRSSWSPDAAAASSWPAAGARAVRARARCRQHPDVVSPWSEALDVAVGVETISAPLAPSGVPVLCVGSSGFFTAGGSTSSVGHPIACRFDWGDGTFSAWLPADSAAHAWVQAGTFDCRAQARCRLDTVVASSWSPAATETVEPHPTLWMIDYDLPELVGHYDDIQNQARRVKVAYDGPRARIVRFGFDMTGRGKGTTCSYDDDPAEYLNEFYVWTRLDIAGKEHIYTSGPMILTQTARDFSGVFWATEANEWFAPKILEPGDSLQAKIYTDVERWPGCWHHTTVYCDLSAVRLFVELDCASE